MGKHETTPKTEGRLKPVPVIEPLRSILAELREANGKPASGPILRGPSGKALNLDNLARRVLIPALSGDGSENSKIEWHGWYSFRRGIATLTTSVAKDPLAAKGLLCHESVATTMALRQRRA